MWEGLKEKKSDNRSARTYAQTVKRDYILGIAIVDTPPKYILRGYQPLCDVTESILCAIVLKYQTHYTQESSVRVCVCVRVCVSHTHSIPTNPNNNVR